MYSNEGGYKDHDHDEEHNISTSLSTFTVSFAIIYILFAIFSLIWFVGGLLGFIASLVCLFYQGSTSDKAIGILLALILGPFYWLFYIYNLNYCTR